MDKKNAIEGFRAYILHFVYYWLHSCMYTSIIWFMCHLNWSIFGADLTVQMFLLKFHAHELLHNFPLNVYSYFAM